jgi:hypothetical protein
MIATEIPFQIREKILKMIRKNILYYWVDCSTCKFSRYPVSKEPCRSCNDNSNYKEK